MGWPTAAVQHEPAENDEQVLSILYTLHMKTINIYRFFSTTGVGGVSAHREPVAFDTGHRRSLLPTDCVPYVLTYSIPNTDDVECT